MQKDHYLYKTYENLRGNRLKQKLLISLIEDIKNSKINGGWMKEEERWRQVKTDLGWILLTSIIPKSSIVF